MLRKIFSLLSLTTAALSPLTAQAGDPVFAPLSSEMQHQLDKQRSFVSELAAKKFPNQKLTGTQKDFSLLQRILDAKLVPKSSTWELQALGVVFGDALADRLPSLAWSRVTDEYGTDPTLRFQATTLQINTLTVISKRVERGEEINVEQLAEQFSLFVATKAAQFK